ncbi:MAG: pilus assembly protein PilM [Phycisphaerae bacterium]|nr:pilus assembly protein PilM [Phycisphaerae bacterium]
MLGIDYGDNRLRVVNIKSKGSGVVVRNAFEIPYSSQQGQSSSEMGMLLRHELEKRNLQKQSVVISLPENLGFVKRYEISGESVSKKEEIAKLLEHTRNSVGIASDDLILDFWVRPGYLFENTGKHVVLIAACQKDQVERCKEIASEADLKLAGIELRSMAGINGLLGNWSQSEQENIAIAYQQDNQCTVAMMDNQGLLSIQNLGLGNKDIVEGLANGLPAVFNTMKLSGDGFWPELILLCSRDANNGQLGQACEILNERLGVITQVCYEPVGLKWDEKPPEGRTNGFVPAIGAALDGLSLTPTWFDMLHPRGKQPEKKHPISWKPALVAFIAAILLALTFWLSLMEQRNTQLAELEDKIKNMAPEIKEIEDAKSSFNLFNSYLSKKKDGNRTSYLRILYEINNQFPDTVDAYITNFNVSKSSINGDYEIKISGRIREGDIINKFIEKLNGSVFFQDARQAGPLLREVGDEFYPNRFSVTCVRKQDADISTLVR